VLEIRIPFKKFNANAFIDKMEVFADKIMDVCYAFPWIEKYVDIPEFDEDKEKRYYIF